MITHFVSLGINLGTQIDGIPAREIAANTKYSMGCVRQGTEIEAKYSTSPPGAWSGP